LTAGDDGGGKTEEDNGQFWFGRAAAEAPPPPGANPFAMVIDFDPAKVGRCWLEPVFASTEYDVVGVTSCPCVMLYELTTCYFLKSA